MTVTREIDGKEITITLTKAEMRKAASIIIDESKVDDVKIAFEQGHKGMMFPYGKDALTVVAKKAQKLRTNDDAYWKQYFQHFHKAIEEYERELL